MSGCGLNRDVVFWGWFEVDVSLIFWFVFRIPLCLCEVISTPSLPGFRGAPITPACGARAGCPRPAGGRAPVTLRTLAGGGEPGSACGAAGRGAPGTGGGYRASGRAAGRPHGCIQIVQRELALLLRARRALLAAHFSSAIGPRRRARYTTVITLRLQRLRDLQCVGQALVLNPDPLVDLGELVVRHIAQRHAVGPDLDATVGILPHVEVATDQLTVGYGIFQQVDHAVVQHGQRA